MTIPRQAERPTGRVAKPEKAALRPAGRPRPARSGTSRVRRPRAGGPTPGRSTSCASRRTPWGSPRGSQDGTLMAPSGRDPTEVNRAAVCKHHAGVREGRSVAHDEPVVREGGPDAERPGLTVAVPIRASQRDRGDIVQGQIDRARDVQARAEVDGIPGGGQQGPAWGPRAGTGRVPAPRPRPAPGPCWPPPGIPSTSARACTSRARSIWPWTMSPRSRWDARIGTATVSPGRSASGPPSVRLVHRGRAPALTYTRVVFADGGAIHFRRVSPGRGHEGAVFEPSGTPTEFAGSRMTWNGQGWDLRLADGGLYWFRACGPGATRGTECGLLGFRDAAGRTLGLTRDGHGDLTRITSPAGQWVELAYSRDHRVTRARDSLGRQVSYTYDALGRLVTVEGAGGEVTHYRYDWQHELASDQAAVGPDDQKRLRPEGTRRQAGELEPACGRGWREHIHGRVRGAGTTISRATITHPDGAVRTVRFDADRCPVSDGYGEGVPSRCPSAVSISCRAIASSPSRPRAAAGLTPDRHRSRARRCEPAGAGA